jgi:diadenosine tetraphosphate (Ap4A) HIT family hydrolase
MIIDERILNNAMILDDWPLSTVILKNEQDVPWVILVPRVVDAKEWMDLNEDEQRQLNLEIVGLSKIMKSQFNCDKLNVASLGNIVPQLHIHIVARTTSDPYWPNSIWQGDFKSNPMSDKQFQALRAQLLPLISNAIFE